VASPLHIIRARPRLFSSAALGLVIAGILALTTSCTPATRALVGWDVGVGVYLVLAFHMMADSDVSRIRRRAAMQDDGQLAILGITIGAALASLGAIVKLVMTDQSQNGLTLAIITIVLSWAFIHTTFSLHYAHEFYGDSDDGGGGLAFPGGEEAPDYWDFVYFSFVIGMTSQVSDVGVTTKQIRRTVAIHGVIAFLFNTALLALTVNIAASALTTPKT
jgi:uncharacterized membrane protein